MGSMIWIIAWAIVTTAVVVLGLLLPLAAAWFPRRFIGRRFRRLLRRQSYQVDFKQRGDPSAGHIKLFIDVHVSRVSVREGHPQSARIIGERHVDGIGKQGCRRDLRDLTGCYRHTVLPEGLGVARLVDTPLLNSYRW